MKTLLKLLLLFSSLFIISSAFAHARDIHQRGIASWYGPKFNHRLTANGERFNMYALTAASKSIPLNTIVKVTNLKNGKSVTVKINDRGPYIKGRILDLSYAAAKEIGMVQHGLADVSIESL